MTGIFQIGVKVGDDMKKIVLIILNFCCRQYNKT